MWFELVGASGAAAEAVDRELTRIFMAAATTFSSTRIISGEKKILAAHIIARLLVNTASLAGLFMSLSLPSYLLWKIEAG